MNQLQSHPTNQAPSAPAARRPAKPKSRPQSSERVTAFTSIEPGPVIEPGFPPTETQIRERAYFIYLERGGTPGDPHADWLQAERELLERARASGATGGV